VGEEGQRRLLSSRVAIAGVGALGSVMANMLTRAGIGYIRLIDFDITALDNLQRQVLYDEQDVAAGLHKVEAAARKLRRINGDVTVEPAIAKLEAHNAEALLAGVDLILDGVDNFAGRFVINDVAVKLGIPWIYGAVAGSYGLTMPIFPREGACLRCLFEEIPPLEHTDTARTLGVLSSTVNVIASLQVVEAVKILTGQIDAVRRQMAQIDVWDAQIELITIPRSPTCKACVEGLHEFID
jgi:adenylyltransferase/sulfurtransferase